MTGAMWPAIMRAMEHDALSKLFFALPPVQADVLRIVAGNWVHLLDLGTLERVSAEHPDPDLTRRAGDLAWRVRFRPSVAAEGAPPPWLLVPTELQSTADPDMDVRVREYVERHLGALRREGEWSREGGAPPVLPVVVYDGAARWRRAPEPLAGLPGVAAQALAPLQPGGFTLLDAGAWALEDWPADNRVTAWVRLLRAGTVLALRAALDEGLADFPGPGDVEFRRALRLWARALLVAIAEPGEDIPAIDDEQGENEMTTLLEASAKRMRTDLIEQGIERGRSEERERLRRELSALKLDPKTAARVSKLLDRRE